MKIESTTVTKLILSGMPNQDVIAVYAENQGPGAGKITITCWGDSWTHYWSHMGEKNTIESFFLKASDDYLACKLKIGIDDEIDDEDTDALILLLKKEIIKDRLQTDISREHARGLWDEADDLWGWGEHHDICFKVFGDEWWHRLPKKPNPDYERLIRIIGFVKQAFAQIQGEQQPLIQPSNSGD